MRPCPNCSREVADDAATCPGCGHDLTAAQAPDALVRAGGRYLLGYTDDAFGIWDRESPRAPVERFPRSDDGERAAISRFEALERLGARPADPGPPEPPPDDDAAAPPPPGGGQAPVSVVRNPTAIAALALGVIALAAGIVGIVAVSLLFGGFAVVLAAVGLRASSAGAEGRGIALAGLALGLLAMIVAFFGFAASFETAIGMRRGAIP